MSNIDLEKDELATQEMLAMLGDDTEAATEAAQELDMDDLLNSIDAVEEATELEATEMVEDLELDSDLGGVINEIIEDTADLSELTELDALMDSEQPNNTAPTTIDAGEFTESVVKETLLDNTAEAMDFEIEDELSSEIMHNETAINNDTFDSELDEGLHDDLLNDLATAEQTVSSVENDTSTKDEDIGALDELEAIESSIEMENSPIDENGDSDELETEDNLLDSLEPLREEIEMEDSLSSSDPLETASSYDETVGAIDTTTNLTSENSLEQVSNTYVDKDSIEVTTTTEAVASELLQKALNQMMEAIQMNEAIQNYAKEVKATTAKATKLALATAQKIQHQALQTQEMIEANFAAAQEAFEQANTVDIKVEAFEVEKFDDATIDEMDAFLAEIQEKNRTLSEANKKISERLASVKLS